MSEHDTRPNGGPPSPATTGTSEAAETREGAWLARHAGRLAGEIAGRVAGGGTVSGEEVIALCRSVQRLREERDWLEQGQRELRERLRAVVEAWEHFRFDDGALEAFSLVRLKAAVATLVSIYRQIVPPSPAIAELRAEAARAGRMTGTPAHRRPTYGPPMAGHLERQPAMARASVPTRRLSEWYPADGHEAREGSGRMPGKGGA